MVAFNQIAIECRKRGLSEVVELAFRMGTCSRGSRQFISSAADYPPFCNGHSMSAPRRRLQWRGPREGCRPFPPTGSGTPRLLPRTDRNPSPDIGAARRGLGRSRRALEGVRKEKKPAIRRLIETAGHAIQSIKPVLMMSPLSIANYIPPACLDFDLVVFDEASQVRPVDALGAIVRGRQIVVVGDSKQMPPTSFFDSLTIAEEVDEEAEEPATADIESILGLFSARGAHQRMLRWHYRSRHESFIAVSNHLFYDNRLVVFPSPTRERKALGLVSSPGERFVRPKSHSYQPGRGEGCCGSRHGTRPGTDAVPKGARG